MKTFNIAILGATGMVGREMLKVLAMQDLPIGSLKAFASPKNAGISLPFGEGKVVVEALERDSFKGVDLVLGAVNADLARKYAPAIAQSGAIFIDNSSAFRLKQDVPLVIPQINSEDAFHHRGIIANPNCSTIIALTAVAALNRISPIRSMVVSTYQAVSGAGAGGLSELNRQMHDYAFGKPLRASVFAHPIAANVIAQIGSDCGNGYTSEEMKMQNEARKILHAPDLNISCTCVRVPVPRCHSISVMLVTERRIDVSEARAALSSAPGCRVIDDLDRNLCPMPIHASDQDLVLVGRIRADLTNANGLCLWCCADQLRKGAATNAVQIAALLAPTL